MTHAIRHLPSPNHDARPGTVDTLILHYTGMQSAEAAIARLRDPVARVSSHYVVDEDGTIFKLVDESARAWHAGISFWRGRRMLNDVSIGIEIVNPGHEFGYRPFPEPQLAAVRALCHEILARWPIPASNVVAHSDVAPNRKQDPGELFPWEDYAASGIGLWPQREVAECGDPAEHLAEIGYDTEGLPLADIVTAFQRHFLPHSVGKELDAQTMKQIAAVAAAFREAA